MTRQEFEAGLPHALAFLGGIWQKAQSGRPVPPRRDDELVMQFQGHEIEEWMLSMEVAIHALAALGVALEKERKEGADG